jgi:hypothetical protein
MGTGVSDREEGEVKKGVNIVKCTPEAMAK